MRRIFDPGTQPCSVAGACALGEGRAGERASKRARGNRAARRACRERFSVSALRLRSTSLDLAACLRERGMKGGRKRKSGEGERESRLLTPLIGCSVCTGARSCDGGREIGGHI